MAGPLAVDGDGEALLRLGLAGARQDDGEASERARLGRVFQRPAVLLGDEMRQT